MFITISEVQVSKTSKTAWHSLGLGTSILDVQNWVPRPSALALSVAALHHSEQSPWWGTLLGYQTVDEQINQGLKALSFMLQLMLAWKHITQCKLKRVPTFMEILMCSCIFPANISHLEAATLCPVAQQSPPCYLSWGSSALQSIFRTDWLPPAKQKPHPCHSGWLSHPWFGGGPTDMRSSFVAPGWSPVTSMCNVMTYA